MEQENNQYLKSKTKNKINKRGDDNMIKKLFKQEKGFTMIELIIVIAIIAILGAIIAPNFAKATTKSKVKSDVASIREINKQIALYMAEHGEYPGENEDINYTTEYAAGKNGGLTVLYEKEYLDSFPKPQTNGLTFSYDATNGKAIISGGDSVSENVKAIISDLSDSDKEFIADSLIEED
ncbi:prepilin-type N-terminal cleavage/methylation domain-containing protein [Defluviitalea phaphyphila]|uniref:prepilin-type N-terminal cleavage/methylation domain-containing protein n=1 Tax=Defluviitalea phaphyphila TaxID=1473580 RepID=UPI00072FFEB9|nr:prepilin-type N-terminal cleavage/methylation domain-containing protein [Defluviitalea phaphyphila]